MALVYCNRWQQLESFEFTLDELHLRFRLLDFSDITSPNRDWSALGWARLTREGPESVSPGLVAAGAVAVSSTGNGGMFAGTAVGSWSSAGSCLTTTCLTLPISLARVMRDDITWIRSSEVRKGRLLNLGSVAAAWIRTSFVFIYLPLRSSKIDSFTFWITSGWFSSLILICLFEVMEQWPNHAEGWLVVIAHDYCHCFKWLQYSW